MRTGADYQAPATGTTQVIIVVDSGGTNIRYRIWGHNAADTTPGSGTPDYDSTNAVDFDNNDLDTTDIITTIAANEFINLELEGRSSGDIDGGFGWVIEIPA